nr:4-hydroxy-3-methylbut-2-enyl diphosphate reductase [Actinomycetota bacterium]
MTETLPQPRGSEAEPDLSPGGPGAGPGPLLICAPMRIEARAIRRGLGEGSGEDRSSRATLLRTGWGTSRAARTAGQVSHFPFGPMAVMGVGAGLTADLKPGDLVVGTEVGAVTCGSAPLLAAELRRAGLRAQAGPITTVNHLVRRAERAALAARGMLLADMESAPL